MLSGVQFLLSADAVLAALPHLIVLFPGKEDIFPRSTAKCERTVLVCFYLCFNYPGSGARIGVRRLTMAKSTGKRRENYDVIVLQRLVIVILIKPIYFPGCSSDGVYDCAGRPGL